ncbi:TerD family protein, partial [Gordonia sp. UBA7860]
MSSPLIKGSKTALVDRTYRIRIRSSGPTIDVSAVLLGANGRVRTDDDFVFFNNPQAPGVRLVSDDEIDVDLGAVAADVDRIVIVGSTEAQGATFGQSGQFSAAVTS